MSLHDIRCVKCGNITTNVLDYHKAPFSECDVCGVIGAEFFEITFERWKSFNTLRDVKGENDLVDDQGRRRAFAATEDPTVMIEVGAINTPGSEGVRTFSPEQSHYYANRIARGEDTPKMRKEILRERTANLKNQGIDAPDAN